MRVFRKQKAVRGKAGHAKQAGRKKSLAAVEDSGTATMQLRRIAGVAVRQAAVENRRHGLAAIVIRGNKVIRVDKNKKEEVLSTLEERANTYRAGQVFYARKG